MSSLLDRIAQGAEAMDQSDYDQWNDTVGSAPPDRFQQAASQAVRQVPPEEYADHVRPNQNTPLNRLPTNERSSIAESLISALTNRNVSRSTLQQSAGISNLDPRQMSPQELAALMQWVQRNHPEVLGQVSQQYQRRPSLLHTILGNKALIGLALGLGAKLLASQLSGGANQSQQLPPSNNQNWM